MTTKQATMEPETTEASSPETTADPAEGIDPTEFNAVWDKIHGEEKSGHVEDESPDDEAEAPDEPHEPGTSDEIEFSESIVKRAENIGLTDEDLDSFNSEDSLKAVLDVMERRSTRKGDAAKPGDGAPEKAPEPSEQFDLGLSEDEFDEDTINVLNKITGHFEKRNAELAAELAALKSSIGNQENERFQNEVNAYLDGLDKDAKALFDRSRRSGRSNVRKLLEEADDTRAGREKNNRPPLTTTELLDRALRTKFGDQISPARRDEQKLRDHQGRFSPRPTRSENGRAVDPDVQMRRDFDKVWDQIEKRQRT
jgi:hypothetical protein